MVWIWLSLFLILAVAAPGQAQYTGYKPGISKSYVDARFSLEAWVGDPNYGPPPDKTGVSDASAYFVALISSIGSAETTLIIPKGTYLFNSDVIFPANIKLQFLKGAVFKSGSVAVSNITYDWTDGAGTMTIATTGNKITGSGTAFNSITTVPRGCRLKTAGDNYYRFLYAHDATNAWVSSAGAANETGVAYKISTHVFTSADTTGLETNDILTCGGQEIIVTRVVNGTTLWSAWYPAATIDSPTAATRLRRIKILGPVEAGRHQIFHNTTCNARLGGGQEVYPEWWGAVPGSDTYRTVNAKAFERAAFSKLTADASVQYNQAATVKVGKGRWYIDRALPLIAGVSYLGDSPTYSGSALEAASGWTGDDLAIFVQCPGGHSISYSTHAGALYGFMVSGLFIAGQNRAVGNQWSAGGIYALTQPTNCIGVIENNLFYQCRWAAQVGQQCLVTRNQVSGCYNGFWMDYDSQCIGNNISFGSNVHTGCANYVLGDGWSRSGETLVAAAGSASDAYLSLSNTGAMCGRRPIALKFTISGRSAGTLSAYVGGTTLASGLTANKGYYYYTDGIVDGKLDNTIRFTKDASFNGTISLIACYTGAGVRDQGAGNLISDNIIFGDNNGAVAVHSTNSASNSGPSIISNNRLGPSGVGLALGSSYAGTGIVTGNLFSASTSTPFFRAIHIQNVAVGAQRLRILNNTIDNCADYGIYLATVDKAFDIRDNVFYNCTNGNIYEPASVTAAPQIEDNLGVDKGAVLTLTVNSANPSVLLGRNFVTANTAGTVISELRNAYVGKRIRIRVNDGNTTFDFSGTSLIRNGGGGDFAAAAGDVIEAVYDDDTNWYCTVFDNTP